jgi:hypothetical protein
MIGTVNKLTQLLDAVFLCKGVASETFNLDIT